MAMPAARQTSKQHCYQVAAPTSSPSAVIQLRGASACATPCSAAFRSPPPLPLMLAPTEAVCQRQPASPWQQLLLHPADDLHKRQHVALPPAAPAVSAQGSPAAESIYEAGLARSNPCCTVSLPAYSLPGGLWVPHSAVNTSPPAGMIPAARPQLQCRWMN